MLSNFAANDLILYGGLFIVAIYVFFKNGEERAKKHLQKKKNIDNSVINYYIKKHKRMFKRLTVIDFHNILGINEGSTKDIITEAYNHKLKKFELKDDDIKYFPEALKEEALKNLALIHYSFNYLQRVYRRD